LAPLAGLGLADLPVTSARPLAAGALMVSPALSAYFVFLLRAWLMSRAPAITRHEQRVRRKYAGLFVSVGSIPEPSVFERAVQVGDLDSLAGSRSTRLDRSWSSSHLEARSTSCSTSLRSTSMPGRRSRRRLWLLIPRRPLQHR
jgi:hypothetical protein